MYVVTDSEGYISLSDDDENGDAPETFDTFEAASVRAQELAVATPERNIRIYALAAEVRTMISAPMTTVVTQERRDAK